jgi:hypothetical protein
MSLDTLPLAYAAITGPVATFTTPDGHTGHIAATADEDIRQMIIERAAEEARRSGIPVELVTTGDRGEHRLVVAADGSIAAATATAIDRTQATDPSQQGEEVNTEAPGHEPIRNRPSPAPLVHRDGNSG